MIAEQTKPKAAILYVQVLCVECPHCDEMIPHPTTGSLWEPPPTR